MNSSTAQNTESPAKNDDDGTGEHEFLHADTSRVIIGASYTLHNELGFGFLEAVYSNGLAVLLRNAGCKVDREAQFKIEYHRKIIGRYKADLLVDDKVVVEVKCARTFDPVHSAQLLNCLRATGLQVGLVLNFGPAVKVKRVASSGQLRGPVKAIRIV